jgi:3D-(3,5/4)-trihydroxycyclohexane-1,2-dione acylhydrolase (decyclizing)
MSTVRVTAAQAMVTWLSRQRIATNGGAVPYFAGAWAIFGHGNVAGVGAALAEAGDAFPTWRAHNEQAMAHAAIAFAKQSRRRRAMVCTTSIGPGATNLVTAAALAHVNRLPVLLVPGDVFAGRRPDPVLQQVEDFTDGTVTANDCFRPVSRYFDRITRPEQLLDCLPRALAVMLDPASCGPVTLAFCQDVQAEAFDCPEAFLEPRTWRIRAPGPDAAELDELAALLRSSRAPLVVAGGGVAYSGAAHALADFCRERAIPFAETQAGKGAIAWDHPCNLGAVGVTGTSVANEAARGADLVAAIGTRLQDFTSGSRALFAGRIVQVNVASHDAAKHGAVPVVADARVALEGLSSRLGDWRAPAAWMDCLADARARWQASWEEATAPGGAALPTDAQVLGAVWRTAPESAVVVCAAGGLPGELHKLWRCRAPGGYHVEYGYSCMGYEIAGGLGVKMAEPAREVHVLVGDGSYLMMNSEIATSVAMGLKLVIVVLDNRGFGCIDRLQRATGGRAFNNLLADARFVRMADIDFAAHAAGLGALSARARSVAQLPALLERAYASDRTFVIVLETDPRSGTRAGGAWWDVAVAETSTSDSTRAARAAYDEQIRKRDGKKER